MITDDDFSRWQQRVHERAIALGVVQVPPRRWGYAPAFAAPFDLVELLDDALVKTGCTHGVAHHLLLDQRPLDLFGLQLRTRSAPGVCQ